MKAFSFLFALTFLAGCATTSGNETSAVRHNLSRITRSIESDVKEIRRILNR